MIKYDIFVAHSLKFTKDAIEYADSLKDKKVYVPGRDTKQLSGSQIIVDNRNAMLESKECHVIWDGVSFGTLFDCGMAYGLQKPVYIVKVKPQSWTTYMQTKIGNYLPI